MRHYLWASSAVVAILYACQGCPSPPLPLEPPHIVILPDASHGTCCELACRALVALGCPEGEPSETGETCSSVCTRAEAAGIDLGSCCIANATTKVALLACRNITGGPAARCKP